MRICFRGLALSSIGTACLALGVGSAWGDPGRLAGATLQPAGSAPADPEPSDAAATRSAAGMLSNVVRQAREVPGSDFIGRLASASAFWVRGDDLLEHFEGSTRAFRVGLQTSQLIVADDGAGNHVRIVVPRADEDLAHVLLEEALELRIIEDGADPEVAPIERYQAVIEGEPVGVLTIEPAPDWLGERGMMFIWVADPVEAPAPDGGDPTIPEGPAYTIQDDGSILMSSGKVIRGDGTPERPFEITWELLASAERVYQPRNGLTGLPEWCKALHEKHVRLTGHLLSPLMMDDTTQILLMRNQWDGCCVGVPPTPYDAVEVELSRPVSLVREQLNYGTITGYFEVDPYLVNNWLVGLWLVSDAKVEGAAAQNWQIPGAAPN